MVYTDCSDDGALSQEECIKQGSLEVIREQQEGAHAHGVEVEELSCLDEGDGELPPPLPGLLEYPPQVILLTVFAGVGGFLFGFDTGVISGAMLFIRDEFCLDDTMQEVVVAAAVFGAIIGAISAAPVNRCLGRRRTTLLGCGCFVTGSILMAMAPAVWLLIVGRVLVGLGVGSASTTVPMYIAECAPVHLRGGLVSVDVLLICTGTFVSYCVDAIFANVPGTWRWMLGLGAIPAAIQAAGIFFLPESPRWLLAHGRTERASVVLASFRASEAEVLAEMEEMQRAVAEEQANEQGRNLYKELLTVPHLRRALVVGVGLQIIQQLAGINTVMYYTPTILQASGIGDNKQAIYSSIVVGAVNALVTVVGVMTIDRFGRRFLLLASLTGVFGALILLAFSFPLGISWLSLLALVLYIVFFAPGMGPVPWAVNAEIFPLYIRGTANSVSAASSWITNFAVSMSFLSIVELLSEGGAFLLYSFFALLGLLFIFFFVPETKGQSLESIRTLFETQLCVHSVPCCRSDQRYDALEEVVLSTGAPVVTTNAPVNEATSLTDRPSPTSTYAT